MQNLFDLFCAHHRQRSRGIFNLNVVKQLGQTRQVLVKWLLVWWMSVWRITTPILPNLTCSYAVNLIAVSGAIFKTLTPLPLQRDFTPPSLIICLKPPTKLILFDLEECTWDTFTRGKHMQSIQAYRYNLSGRTICIHTSHTKAFIWTKCKLSTLSWPIKDSILDRASLKRCF